MSRILLNIKIELLSDTIFSSENSVPGDEDITLLRDRKGYPYIPGSTIKGLLRESMENYLNWTGQSAESLSAILGEEGIEKGSYGRRAVFGRLRMFPLLDKMENWFSHRGFTSVTQTGKLRKIMCIHCGVSFGGILLCDSEDEKLISHSLQAIHYMGLQRNRGFGHVRITAKGEKIHKLPAIENSHWIHYRLNTLTPVFIPNMSRSEGKDRNFTTGKKWIPGSAMRGMVLSYLAEQMGESLPSELFRDLYFRNALPMKNGHSQIPTPMGFYDEKNGTHPYSVLLQDVKPGHKRVPLPQFSYTEEGEILGGDPEMVASVRIRRDNRKIFTVRAIGEETELEGYIYLRNAELAALVSQAFQEYIWLGADRYSGFGLCRVTALDSQPPDYSAYTFSEKQMIPQNLWMLLLAPATMMENGEPVGISCDQLAEKLGVERVSLGKCASAITEMSGFNRHWGCPGPRLTMYEAGSIFTLCCEPAPRYEKLLDLQEKGIGAGLQEGYGAVLFLENFPEKFRSVGKQNEKIEDQSHMAEIRRAGCRFLRNPPYAIPLSQRQMGMIQEICQEILAGEKTLEDLESYFQYNIYCRGNRYHRQFAETKRILWDIFQEPLQKTLQLEECPNVLSWKLQLIVKWLSMCRRGGNRR